ncbi:MAG TPA: cytochrome c-type biogenesis protein CcmH [Acidobacteriota bacterium]|jgi:cytochrome c-type biogenesis protein CcmH
MWFRFLLALMILTISPSIAGVTKEQVQDVTSQLVCLCGCGNKTVSVCGCGLADQTTKEVEKMLQEGKTKEQILAQYVNKGGISVLAAPPKSGFNLTAWVLPFLGIFVAGVFLVVKMKHWQAAAEKQEADVERQAARSEASPVADSYRQRMNEELEKID